jgi:hypothetical protein
MMVNGETWALVVGIDEYDFGVPLPGAVNAAVQFAELLCVRGVKPEQIHLCLGPDPAGRLPEALKDAKRRPPTFGDMRKLLERDLPERAGRLLCLFWAGHGAVDGRARRLFLADSGLYGTFDFDALLWLLGDERYRFPKQLIFVDACANDPGPLGMHRRGWDFGMDAARAPSEGQFVFFSASLGQPAEFAGGNGVYSRELVRLLQANPPPASLEDLRDRLREYFDTACGPQRPFYHFRLARDRSSESWGGHGGGSAPSTGSPIPHDDVPPLPVGYVERPDELAALRALVLRGPDPGMVITAVRGMPGAGKSVLVTALLQDKAIAQAYPDGALWVKVGQGADPLRVMHQVAVTLGEPWGNHLTPDDGSSQVRRLLGRRRALIVLDDVWDASHVLNLRSGAAGSALLVTTRRDHVVSQTGAVELRLGKLTEAQARRLLASRCGRPDATLPAEADMILKECGHLALAVAIAGARLRLKPPAVWGVVLQELRSANLDGVGSLEEYEHRSVFRAIHVSVRDLPEPARGRYRDICAFPEDVAVPTAALGALWNAPAEEVLPTAEAWLDRALAEFDAAGRVTFHDLHLDYARRAHGDPAPIHRRLLDSYRRRCGGDAGTPLWSAVPDDGYFRRYLTYHLEAAASPGDIHRLLAEQTSSGQNAWYEAKAAIGDVPGYVADVQRAWRLAGGGDRGDPQAVAARVALQVRYLLVTSSVRSIISGVWAGLWADALAEEVVTDAATLALIREIPEEPAQAEMLLGVMDRLEEANRLKAAHRLLALAERMEPSSRAALLLKLAPRLPQAGREKALDLAASAAGTSTSPRVRVDTFCVQAALAADATARRARLEEALVAAKQLAPSQAAWGPLVRLALLLPDKVAEIVDVFLSRKADEAAAREEYVGHIATLLPLVGDGDRHRLIQEALAAASSETEFKWARLLRPVAPYLPTETILRRWGAVRGELAQHRDEGMFLNFSAPAGVELAGLLQADARSPATEEVLDAVRAMTSDEGAFGVYGKAEALALLVPLVPGETRASLHAEALQAAAHIRTPGKKARVLHLLASQAEKPARAAIVRTAWDLARSLDDADDVVGAVGAFAPWLDVAGVKEALGLVEQHPARAGNRRGDSLRMLAARLAEIGHPDQALRVLAKVEDSLGQVRAEGVLGVVRSLTSHDLDNALAVVRNMPPGCYRALARFALSSRFPDKRDELVAEAFGEPFEERLVDHLAGMTDDLARLGFLRDAVQLAREKVEDREDQSRVLRSIAGSLPPSTDPTDIQWLLGEVTTLFGPNGDLWVAWALAPGLCPAQVVRRALEMIDRWRDSAAKAGELSRWLPHLPRGDRAARVKEVLSALPDVRDEPEKSRLLHLAAPHLTEELIGQASALAATIDQQFIRWLLPLPARFAELGRYDEARRFVDSIRDPGVRARALAGLLPHAPPDRRTQIIAESFAALSESDDRYERSKVWAELGSSPTVVSAGELELVWRDTLLTIAGKRRDELLMDVEGMLPLISHLGGTPAVRLAFEALRDTTRWWK